MPSPELENLVAMLRAAPLFEGSSIEANRESMDRIIETMPIPDDVRYSVVDAGGVSAEWAFADSASEDRVILYFHGGGYCLGSPATHRLLVGNLSRESLAGVLSVDYRLAPEHPFPACLDDALRAYEFVLNSGTPAERIVLAGDSAGGGIAAGMQLCLRREGLPMPAAAVLLSPWLDLTLTAETIHSRAEVDVCLTGEMLAICKDAYLNGANPETPEASPVLADLSGLPPQLIHVGDAEILLDDSRTYAERAKASGVQVTIEVWKDLMHVFPAFEGLLPEADESISKIAAFIRRHVP